jgi:hypothetical protein
MTIKFPFNLIHMGLILIIKEGKLAKYMQNLAKPQILEK